MKKNITFSIAVVGLLLYLFGKVIDAAMSEAFSYDMIGDLILALPLVLGVSFLVSEKEVTQTVGLGLIATMSTVFFVQFISNDFLAETVDINYYNFITGILFFIVVVIHIILSLLEFFGFQKVDTIKTNKIVSKAAILEKWQSLLEKGKLNEDSYNLIKQNVLDGSFNQQEQERLEEIRNLVELNLISEVDVNKAISSK